MDNGQMIAEEAEDLVEGEWLSSWDAFGLARELMDRKGGAIEPIGSVLARMAMAGYLPTAATSYTHSVPNPTGDKEEVSFSDESSGEVVRYHAIHDRFWAGVAGISLYENKNIISVTKDWKSGHFLVVYGQSKDLNAASRMSEVLSDPGFYMVMAWGVTFYKDALYGISRFVSGLMDEDDRYLPGDAVPKNPVPGVPVPTLGDGEPSRGRPGGRAGEPIASLTIKMMGLSAAEFERHNRESLAMDLIETYRSLGLVPPGNFTAIKDAGGILRALRKARSA